MSGSMARRVIESILNNNDILMSLDSALSSSSSTPPPRSPAAEVRNIFQRGAGPRFQFARNFACEASAGVVNSRRRRRARSDGPSASFLREVCLLPSPGHGTVPRGQLRLQLCQTGYILSGVNFRKDWSESEVLTHIRNLFRTKIAECTQIEIVKAICTTLVRPTLEDGKVLDGQMVCFLFKDRTIYVRPMTSIQSMQPVSTQRNDVEEEPDHESQPESQSESIYVRPSTSIQSMQPVSTQRNDVEEGPDPESQPESQSEYNEYVGLGLECEHSFEDSDEELSLAIEASLQEGQAEVEAEAADILSSMAEHINVNATSRFSINRSDVLDGAFRGFTRKSYNAANRMSIKFADDAGRAEEAVDLGGPRREFLRLLIEALRCSCMFEGTEEHKNLALNSISVREDHYYLAGQAFAVSMVHGGPSPGFFSNTLFECVTKGPANAVPIIDDVNDMDLQQKIKAIADAGTIEELRDETASLQDYLANAGCLCHLRKVEDKEMFVKDILRFQVINRVHQPLERFIDGLKTLGVLEKLQQHPEAFRALLCHRPTKLTADVLDKLFDIRFSSPGSNRRTTENRVVAFWRDYLQDTEEGETDSTLENLLIFATGSSGVPPIGFSPEPSLEFHHTDATLPTANTCVNCLCLPTTHATYNAFKDTMDFALGNTHGFGQE